MLRGQLAYKKRVQEKCTPEKDYDMRRAILHRRIPKYRPLLSKIKKGVNVELGCGTGAWVKELLDSGSETVIGIDFVLGTLNIANEYCPRGRYILGDLNHLPFKSECVDAFFSFTSIYYLNPGSRSTLFAELYKSLKEGGNIILVEPNDQCIIKDMRGYPIHKKNIKHQLEKAGFTGVVTEFRGFVPTFVKKRGEDNPIFILFRFMESIVERFQIPFLLGGLAIYAEK